MATRAVFCDALGTIVELEPPWQHLAGALGIEADRRLRDAVRAEMGYYREHAHEGRDEGSLADLRERCARVLSRELGMRVPVEAMMDSIRFRAYPDAPGALAGLAARGLTLVCVSNWDISLPAVLERCRLAEHFDAVLTSAATGSRKPDPAIFEAALERAGVAAREALHVGDTASEDVEGAARAGIPALLLDRDGGGDIASLDEISEHLRR